MLIHYITYTYQPSIHRHFGSFDEKLKHILISHSEREISHSQSESHHIRSGAILTFQASSLEHYSHRERGSAKRQKQKCHHRVSLFDPLFCQRYVNKFVMYPFIYKVGQYHYVYAYIE